jgi:hypothetical protein
MNNFYLKNYILWSIARVALVHKAADGMKIVIFPIIFQSKENK